MTPEQLLQPRYELVHEYPHSYETPCILHVAEDGELYSKEQGYLQSKYKVMEAEAISKYPHLFRPLPWYEGMAVEDMPEYIRDIHFGTVHKVIEWTPQLLKHSIQNYTPATLTEYEQYSQLKK